jgi:hypothetical protein
MNLKCKKILNWDSTVVGDQHAKQTSEDQTDDCRTAQMLHENGRKLRRRGC